MLYRHRNEEVLAMNGEEKAMTDEFY